MSIPVQHIVFDIGKVLIHYDPHLGLKDIIPDDAERQWFFDNICTHDWNLEQDRGRTWEEAEGPLLEQFPDRAEQIRGFRRNWQKMVPYAYEGSVDILRSLIAAGHDVTMLTNFASDTFREAQQLYPFLTESRGVTVSGDVRMLKPEQGIYDLHVQSFDLNPASSLFIDDSMPNVEGAIAAGWQSVHFTSPEALRADLQRLNIQF